MAGGSSTDLNLLLRVHRAPIKEKMTQLLLKYCSRSLIARTAPLISFASAVGPASGGHVLCPKSEKAGTARRVLDATG
uniref:Uncharacterized protein n=1 Tax=Pristionchus pacificus TaxID=54126 RepID=A0A2A6CJR8_PRIPA|eukprot:PDM78360.1 hypothetical protein PRIPAC_30939 [Pristionchus pacificus]